MKGRLACLGAVADREAAALLVDGRLDDLLVEGPDDVPVPGAIYRAVAERPMKGQGGLILRLPEGRAWLRQGKGIAPGAALIVQVTGYAEEGKAVPVAARPVVKARHAIATPGAPGFNVSRRVKDDDRREALLLLAHDVAGPPGETGLILRHAAMDASDDAVAADIEAVLGTAAQVMSDMGTAPELLLGGPGPHDLAWTEWPADDADDAPGAFAAHGVDAMIDAVRHPRVDLGPAWITIEPTRALVAIDVNTGGDTSLAAGLKANLAAAAALPAQLRCRGLGGKVVIDMAPAPRKDRRQIENALRRAFRADQVETALAGWTPLGAFELQRKRDRLPLTRLLPD